jgi:hypothetical protein
VTTAARDTQPDEEPGIEVHRGLPSGACDAPTRVDRPRSPTTTPAEHLERVEHCDTLPGGIPAARRALDKAHTALATPSRSRPGPFTPPTYTRENPLNTTPTTPPGPANPGIDTAEEVRRLRALAAGFTALKTQLVHGRRAFDAAGPGWLTGRIGDSLRLTSRALERLKHLSGTDLAAVPGHRAALERLAAVVQDATGATHALAIAVAEFPFDAAGPGPQPDAAACETREHRNRQAHATVRDALQQAVNAMEVCETACLHSATALARSAASRRAPSASAARTASAPDPAAPAQPLKLTTAQQVALRAIAAGGVRMRESGRNGPMRISAGAGVRITIPTYDRLQSLGLVDRDTSSSLYRGQELYATDAGRTALAALNAPATTRPPAPTPPPAARRR